VSEERPKERRSPRGLLTNTTGPAYGSLTAKEKERLAQRDLRFDPIEPGKWAITGAWPETRESIDKTLSFWRQFADAIKADSDQSGEDVLDRAHAAEQILRQVARIETYLKRIEDIPGALLAIHETLILATLVHQLTIVDNETDIASGMIVRTSFADHRAQRTKDARHRNEPYQAMAVAIWRKHPKWSKSRVSEEIAKKRGQKANANTIRRTIKKTPTKK
jgi:hypothetical protein